MFTIIKKYAHLEALANVFLLLRFMSLFVYKHRCTLTRAHTCVYKHTVDRYDNDNGNNDNGDHYNDIWSNKMVLFLSLEVYVL